MKFVCAYCGGEGDQPSGAVNRARKAGLNLYCSPTCSGFGRRKWKSAEQKKLEKAKYDAQRRVDLAEEIRAAKAEYFQRTYDPVAAAAKRQERMPYHIEYCRQPEYRRYKSEYDLQRRAAEYGEFADAYMLLLEVNRSVNERMSDYDVRVANDTINKRLKRRRAYAALISGRP